MKIQPSIIRYVAESRDAFIRLIALVSSSHARKGINKRTRDVPFAYRFIHDCRCLSTPSSPPFTLAAPGVDGKFEGCDNKVGLRFEIDFNLRSTRARLKSAVNLALFRLPPRPPSNLPLTLSALTGIGSLEPVLPYNKPACTFVPMPEHLFLYIYICIYKKKYSVLLQLYRQRNDKMFSLFVFPGTMYTL